MPERGLEPLRIAPPDPKSEIFPGDLPPPRQAMARSGNGRHEIACLSGTKWHYEEHGQDRIFRAL
jgi:hypothetical protein